MCNCFSKNLRLGEGSALPVGVPVPWPTNTAPDGWLKCNGATFDKTKYPKLAVAYSSGKLPDLRGEFIRGWDDGRGVDSGRSLMTSQAGSSIGRFAGNVDRTAYIYTDNFDYQQTGSATWSKLVATTSAELGQVVFRGARPRNISFNYIVRAA
ncbi:hypothetical protein E3360_08465 [Salmonella enterica subsp. enterica serovar Carmel]|nr:hypothetical protein [Salmonella enterica subsp. enterica serovar Carmel]ECF4033451.1 hypothetical protein [Salmonella enterica subsp. enterica serovar Carmel]